MFSRYLEVLPWWRAQFAEEQMVIEISGSYLTFRGHLLCQLVCQIVIECIEGLVYVDSIILYSYGWSRPSLSDAFK
jgi:hypothetical protein